MSSKWRRGRKEERICAQGGAQRGQNLLLTDTLTTVILPVQAECCPPPLPGDERPLLQLPKGVSLQRGGKYDAPLLQCCGFGEI
jgi:hypothetical protein